MTSILPSFIVFEGLDGSGKSTQAQRLATRLEKAGMNTLLTKEPTERPIGHLVRQVLRHEVETTDRALALLYAADRSDHLELIRRELSKGTTVISDRYFYSSLAYQGLSLDKSFLKEINSYPHAGTVVFVDTPAEECMKRIETRGEDKELFDRLDWLEKVRKNFLSVFAELPSEVKFLTVDGMKDADRLEEEIFSFISR